MPLSHCVNFFSINSGHSGEYSDDIINTLKVKVKGSKLINLIIFSLFDLKSYSSVGRCTRTMPHGTYIILQKLLHHYSRIASN
jgi:hypothetical protein